MSSEHRPRHPGARERLAGTLFRHLLKLPKPPGDYTVTKDIRIPTRDGVDLLAQHWAPIGAAAGTVVVHSPYGWNALFRAVYAAPYAARGYHVVLCSSRGTFGSGGEFDPMMTEVDDTADLAAWLRTQSWFEGRFAMAGASYLGFTQWATLMDPPPELVAAVVQVGFHDLSRTMREGGGFKLNDFLAWSEFVGRQEEYGVLGGLIKLATIARRIAPAFEQLPLGRGTAQVLGDRAPWFQRWFEHPDVGDQFWTRAQLGEALDRVKVPVLLHTGWMDIFLDQTMEQYARLSERGIDVGLTVGPWLHSDIEGKAASQLIPEALDWLAMHLDGAGEDRRSAPVKIFVSGADEWRDLSHWPPRTEPRTLYPHRGGTLRQQPPGGGAVTFTYDPADPTPTVGGRLLTSQGGYREDSVLAARSDVLTFTGEPLTEPLEIIGSPVVTLIHRSDNPHADLFVRISEVDPKGRSRNVTDGYVRLNAAAPGAGDSESLVRVELDPTAHRFAAGGRVRLTVAGGSYPRFDRNLGTGEAPWTATTLVSSTRTIHLAGSQLHLPVIGAH